MKNFRILWRRELAAYLVSPATYITMFAVLAVSGWGFWFTTKCSRGEPARIDILLFQTPTLLGMLLIAATALTMRLFAEEKRSGTIETLMTAPVSEISIVLGKYAAALTIFVIMFAPTAAYAFILQKNSDGMELLDTRVLVSGYLIFFLIGAFYLSVGMLTSSLSSSQTVAAVFSFASMFVLFLAGGLTSVARGKVSSVVAYVSPFQHILDFSRGVVDTGPVVIYLSGTALMLFATVKVIESRRWY
ncbi:MAG: ABC transporter permease subunit [bacterium]